MSSADIALLICGSVVVVLALIAATVWAIHQDYKVALSATIARRNPPKAPKEPA